jgi:hypothetical protein
MAIELRCDKRLHGVLTDDGVLEVSCRSSLCGHRDGVVVIHKFDAATGEFLGTSKFRDAPILKEEVSDGHSPAVRHA